MKIESQTVNVIKNPLVMNVFTKKHPFRSLSYRLINLRFNDSCFYQSDQTNLTKFVIIVSFYKY